MVILKETAEEVSVALDKVRALRAWASVSFARFLFVAALLGAVLVGGQYAYVNYHLLTEARKAGENRTREITALGKEDGYKVALDAITTCLESAKEKPTLNAWYCKQAVIQYRKASTNWLPERVKEVIDKHAYVAMKNDVSHHLRNVELDRLMNSPASREEEVLKLLLSNTAVAIWLFVVVVVMIGAYLFFWILPNRKRGAPDA
jgi:hypothetical protein